MGHQGIDETQGFCRYENSRRKKDTVIERLKGPRFSLLTAQYDWPSHIFFHVNIPISLPTRDIYILYIICYIYNIYITFRVLEISSSRPMVCKHALLFCVLKMYFSCITLLWFFQKSPFIKVIEEYQNPCQFLGKLVQLQSYALQDRHVQKYSEIFPNFILELSIWLLFFNSKQ